MKSGRLTLSIVILFIGLVFVNYLATAIPARVDVTADRIYTLSDGTKKLLGEIEEPITVDFYFSRSANGLPISYKNYADRVEELLHQYVSYSNGRIELNIVDPKPDTDEEENAEVAGVSVRALASGDPLLMGVVATQADQQKVIAQLDPEREPFLEYDLSELIYDVQQLDRKKLGILSPLPIQKSMNSALIMAGRATEGQYASTMWSRSFDLVTVDPTAATLPDGLDLLAIIHPQTLRPEMEYAIDQFILSGRPVFLALDPSSYYAVGQNSQLALIGSAPQDFSSELPDLLQAYGVDFDVDHVVGDPTSGTSVTESSGAVTQLPVWLSLTSKDFNLQSQPLAQLDTTLFVEAGALSPHEGSTTTFTPLIQTSDQAGTVPSELMISGTTDEISRAVKASGKKTIAALVTGKFPTAFPNGKPQESSSATPAAAQTDAANAQKSEAEPAAPALKESTGNSTLFVVGDTDWLFDNFSGQKVNFLGQTTFRPFNDNVSLAANMMEYLGGSAELISIRGKGNAVRPFEVIQGMKVAANEKYQKQLTTLDDQLTQIETQLSQLQTSENEDGTLITPPETEKAIADFQKQKAETNQKVREIKRVLTEDINSLENRLLLANLAFSPLVLCVVGLWYHRHRRRR